MWRRRRQAGGGSRVSPPPGVSGLPVLHVRTSSVHRNNVRHFNRYAKLVGSAIHSKQQFVVCRQRRQDSTGQCCLAHEVPPHRPGHTDNF